MTLFDYVIIAVAVMGLTLVVGVASMAVRNLQKLTAGHLAGASPPTGPSGTGPAFVIPGSDPLSELTRLPEPDNSPDLPQEAKSVLMNAVWYRCENPKCNYTQFLDVYQIVSREMGGSYALDNLVVLCPECRHNARSGQIDDDVLGSWIKSRVERFKFTLDWPYK